MLEQVPIRDVERIRQRGVELGELAVERDAPSTSCIVSAAVNIFVTDPMRYRVFVSAGSVPRAVTDASPTERWYLMTPFSLIARLPFARPPRASASK
jgi:hypothetical protein